MAGYGIGKYVGEQKSGHVHVKIHKGTRVLWFRTMCSPDTGIMGFTCNFVPGKLLLRFPSQVIMSRVKRGCSPYVSSLAKGAREIFVQRQLSKLLHGCPRLVRWPIFVVVTVVVTHLRFHRLFPSTSLLPSFLPPAHTHHVPHLTSDR